LAIKDSRPKEENIIAVLDTLHENIEGLRKDGVVKKTEVIKLTKETKHLSKPAVYGVVNRLQEGNYVTLNNHVVKLTSRGIGLRASYTITKEEDIVENPRAKILPIGDIPRPEYLGVVSNGQANSNYTNTKGTAIFKAPLNKFVREDVRHCMKNDAINLMNQVTKLKEKYSLDKVTLHVSSD